MRQCLRKIAEHSFRTRIILLGKQTHVIANRKQTFKQVLCFLAAAGQNQGIRKPEGACQEGALPAGKASTPVMVE